MDRGKREGIYLGITLSCCPECLDLVQAQIIARSGKVYFHKFCPNHGTSSALVSEDVDHYLKTRNYAAAGTIPHRFRTTVDRGCPHDCGLCPDHQQHTCHPIVDITDRCNLACPICIADNAETGFLNPAAFGKIVEGLIASEGSLENLSLSGGEPSLHPVLWELIAIAERPEITRISLITNGIRIAGDRVFCEKLKERRIYVILQWDGFDDDVYRILRGQPLMRIKEQALANLTNLGIPTQLVFTAARGINEHQLGQAFQLLLTQENILSLAIQPLALIGKGGSSFSHDPLDRLTVPGVIKALADQSSGLLRIDDFLPLPCSNPECVSLTYLLRLDEGVYVPFPRFADLTGYLHLISQSATIEPNRETEDAMHEIISDLWSTSGEVPDNERITRALRRAILEMFPAERRDRAELIRASERQAKSIFIHHYMDRHSFDLARVVKCCHHFPRSDGRLMPICSFNLFHRRGEVANFVA